MTFDFDLAPRSVPVSLDKIPHVLFEASEGAACQYEAARARPMAILDGRMTGLEGAAEAETLLLSLCLFRTLPDGSVKLLPNGDRDPSMLVPLTSVRALNSRITRPLIEWVKDNSGLSVKKKKDADPEMVGRCRRDLSSQHHPDLGGNEDVMRGINIACDWLRARLTETPQEQVQIEGARPNS